MRGFIRTTASAALVAVSAVVVPQPALAADPQTTATTGLHAYVGSSQRVRTPDGTWLPARSFSFGPGVGGTRTATVVGGEQFIFAIRYAGDGLPVSTVLVVQRADGTFAEPHDLGVSLGAVNAATVAGEVHLVNRDLQHTIRHPDGTVDDLHSVIAETGSPGPIRDVEVAGIGGELHVVVVTDDGGIRHAIRRSDGTWSSFGDVEAQAGDRGDARNVAIAEVGGALHVAVTSDRGLFHTIREPSGGWAGFGDVEGQAGDGPTEDSDITAAGVGGEFHLMSNIPRYWLHYTTRRADGGWNAFRSFILDTGSGPIAGLVVLAGD